MDKNKTETHKPNRACQQAMLAYARWLAKQPPKEKDPRYHWLGGCRPEVTADELATAQ